MTARTMQQPTETMGTWFVALAFIGCVAMSARVEPSVAPNGNAAKEAARSEYFSGADFTVTFLTDRSAVLDGVRVETGFHAESRHGLVEASEVRQAMAIRAQEEPVWFNRPPCKDGRWRYVLALADGSWAVWVLEQGPIAGSRVEVTAFKTWRQDYVNRVREDCGDDDWRGHSFTQEGQDDQKGVRAETTAVCAG